MREKEEIDTIGFVFDKILRGESLSWLWWHLQKHPMPIAMMTTFKKDYSSDENYKKINSLSFDLRTLDYGFVQINALSQQKDADVKGEGIMLVIDERNDAEVFKNAIKTLCLKYDQEYMVFKNAEVNKVFLVDVKSGKETSLGRWHPNKMGGYFSKMRKEKIPFKLKDAYVEYLTSKLKYKPSGMMGKLGFHLCSQNKKIF